MNTDVDYLLSPESIRERTHQIYRLCEAGETHFNFHKEKLKGVAEFVCSVIKENYPNLNIPYHSRWGHFNAGKIDRLSHFFRAIQTYPAYEQARIKYDLVLVSVLLDAGAGAAWRYKTTNEDIATWGLCSSLLVTTLIRSSIASKISWYDFFSHNPLIIEKS